MKRVSAIAWVLMTSSALAGPLPSPEADFPTPEMDEVKLGQLLYYDPILSGSKTVSCATCHHPRFATADGVSLGLGDGGVNLGPERVHDRNNPPEKRIPRNAPALFNLGASEFTTFFHDGRLEQDPTRPSGLRTPLGPEMEQGFDSALAAQAMFPVLSGDEMAGHYSENEIAQAVRRGVLTGEGGAWDLLSKRIEAVPEYRQMFDPLIGTKTPIAFTHIANAIASFITFEWRADDSPFDRYLSQGTPLSASAERGLNLFYGKAACDTCHSGLFQTDHGFHAIAMPQIGPGKTARFERHNRDTGRMRVTGDPADAYRFRTPTLRNIAHTAPYGHAGSHATLEAVIRHHLDPVAGLMRYDPTQAVLPGASFPDDLALYANLKELFDIAEANELAPFSLSDTEIADLIAFLEALTDETALKGRLGIPKTVPSGLPVDQ